MSKKSFISLILIASMLCTGILAGCGNDDQSEKQEASVQSKAASKTEESSKTVSKAAEKTESKASKADEKSKAESKTESSEEKEKTAKIANRRMPTKIVDDDKLPLPEIEDPTPDEWGEDINNIFVYNGTAYSYFYGDEDMAKYYAGIVSDIKKKLGKNVKVYNVIVPTNMGVCLPEKFDGQKGTSQKDYMNTVVTSYTEDVIGVDTFDKLAHHRNEYLYFSSDHHWTALGAYYAYRAFAEKAGIQPIDLMKLKSDKFDDFQGSFTTAYDVPGLNSDTVWYYYPDYDIEAQLLDENGENPMGWSIMNTYVSTDTASYVFLGGDQPIIVSKNEKGNGRKVAIIKESFGNFFAPFICYTYGETHIIDPRHVNIDLKSYIEKNGINEVIVINNVTASATDIICDAIKDMISGEQSQAEQPSQTESTESSNDDTENSEESSEEEDERFTEEYDDNYYF